MGTWQHHPLVGLADSSCGPGGLLPKVKRRLLSKQVARGKLKHQTTVTASRTTGSCNSKLPGADQRTLGEASPSTAARPAMAQVTTTAGSRAPPTSPPAQAGDGEGERQLPARGTGPMPVHGCRTTAASPHGPTGPQHWSLPARMGASAHRCRAAAHSRPAFRARAPVSFSAPSPAALSCGMGGGQDQGRTCWWATNCVLTSRSAQVAAGTRQRAKERSRCGGRTLRAAVQAGTTSRQPKPMDFHSQKALLP